MTKTTSPVNLFAAATKVKETAKKTPEKKIVIRPDLGTKVLRYSELKQQIEAATGELKMIEGDLKVVGKGIFLEEYHRQLKTPDNFKIQDATGTSVMFIAMDKYTVVDQTKAEVLGQFDNLLDEKTVFTFNAELVEKYGQVLSELILNSPDIEDGEKPLLISGEKSFSVRKGSIDRLLQYDSPEQVFELINPICSLKK